MTRSAASSPLPSSGPASGPQGRLSRFRRAAQHGWPASYPLVQFPNLPVVIGVVALLTSMTTTGSTHDAALAIGRTFLAIWAYLELTSGINGFRRTIGGVVLAAVLWKLVT